MLLTQEQNTLEKYVPTHNSESPQKLVVFRGDKLKEETGSSFVCNFHP